MTQNMSKSITINQYKFTVVITGFYGRYHNSGEKYKRVFSGLSIPLLGKYKWYFDYLAARFKVDNPKSRVEIKYIKEIAKTVVFNLSANQQKGTIKRKFTIVDNALSAYIKQWSGLFPIDDDDHYKKLVNKRNQLQKQLDNFCV